MEALKDKIQNPLKTLKSSENILISEIYNNGGSKARQKDKYSCIFCNSSDALGTYRNRHQEMNFKCFSCGESGDVISLDMKKRGVTFIESLKYLCDKNGIPLDIDDQKNFDRVVKSKVVSYFEQKYKKALEEGDKDNALRYSLEMDRQAEQNYYIDFPFKDAKNNPLKIWENVKAILDHFNIVPVYNVISKEIVMEGMEVEGYENQVIDTHSMCYKVGFPIQLKQLGSFINRCASGSKYNPVADYLLECEFLYDGETDYISMLCDVVTAKKEFDNEFKNTLIKKWLFNTAHIAFNEGTSFTEGCLVFQGPQGCGKTTFIKELIPNEFLKTGLDINPEDKDSVRKATRYWVAELGELDSTMKSDQAKLKAFLTEPVDEYRLPYAANSQRYPRTTSFFGTVNKHDFLKDETGSRRYWVIPVESIDINKMREIDMRQLWGQVMTELPNNLSNMRLSNKEFELLMLHNEQFNVKGNVEIATDAGFEWTMDKDRWVFMSTSDIAHSLGLKSTGGLKSALEKNGAVPQRKKLNGSYVRGFLVPPFITIL